MPLQVPHTRRISDGTVQQPHTRLNQHSGRSPQQIVAEKCSRFRVLVMGRRNAGKTTLLEKMTQSAQGGKVEIRDSEGKLVDDGSILQPSVERGQSCIEWEITYTSNPGFVFHDSRGMEAGSTEELKKVRAFLEERRHRVSLEERIHVIWYCLPTDTSRPLCAEEMSFFAQGTENVPVIAIFTKFEKRVTDAVGVLREEGMTLREAKKMAPARALHSFEEEVLNKREMKYPPAARVYLQDMHKQQASCIHLTEATHCVIQDQVIQDLFAIIQRNSVEVSVGIAMVYAISLATEKHGQLHRPDHKLHDWTALLLSLFPYWKEFLNIENLEFHWTWTEDWATTFDFQEKDPIRTIVNAVLSWNKSELQSKRQLMNMFVDILVIAECLFWEGKETPWQIDIVQKVVEQYGAAQLTRAAFSDMARRMHNETSSILGYDKHIFRKNLTEMGLRYEKELMESHFQLQKPCR